MSAPAPVEGLESAVVPFYSGRSVLVTGASGLVGKVLVEKLLWAVQDIRGVFILVRTKRGRTPQERLRVMLELPVFDRVRRECPGQFSKLFVVAGDVGQDGLGLADEDLKRLRAEVSVVLHCAATLKLDSSLKDALNVNTRGTQRVLELARTMPRLQAFSHISTTFCLCDLPAACERAYPPPHSPEDVMGGGDLVDEASLERVTETLIHPHPNPYTYSKRLAEDLVARQFPELPVCILRPSIVIPAWQEPVPGWVDNLNGPVGVMVGAGKGVIRSMYCNGDYRAELIPLDFVANATLVATYHVAVSPRETSVPVFNLTAGKWRSVTWSTVLDEGRRASYHYPFEMILWYPGGDIYSSKLQHDVCAFFLHSLPAYFIDFMMFVFRQPRFMVRVHKRIAAGLSLLQYFTTRQWAFANDRFMALWDSLGHADRRLFNFDLDSVKIEDYVERCVLGGRQYCMKEPLSSIPRQRRRLRLYYLADRALHLLLRVLLAWLLYMIISQALSTTRVPKQVHY